MRLAALLVSLVVLSPRAIRAEDDTVTRKARELFVEGGELVKRAEWSLALTRFEESARLRPHAVTYFNIGVTRRALGRHYEALRALRQADIPGELSPSLREELHTTFRDITELLSHVNVTITPDAPVTLSVDGASVEPVGSELSTLFEGNAPPYGVGKPGESASVPMRLHLVLDPGTHVFAIRHPDFSEVVETLALAPGKTRSLEVSLRRRPLSLRIAANPPFATVRLNDEDLGPAPLTVERPAGIYRVVVRSPGYVPFETTLRGTWGQHMQVMAPLRREKPPITSKWWFWTAGAGLVLGVVGTTYVLTRPAPERPAPDGGGLGWTVRIP